MYKNTLIQSLLLLAGIFFIIVGILTYLSNSYNWPSAGATVVSSEKKIPWDNELNPYYDVFYTYWVNGRVFSSSSNMPSDKPPGEKITIYYDPASPERTILSAGELEWHGLGSLVLGLVFAGEAIWNLAGAAAKKDQP